MAFDIEPLSPLLGLTVRGLELHEPLTDDRQAEFRRLVSEHYLLHLPEQEIGPDEHVRFLGAFGHVAQWSSGDRYTFVRNRPNASNNGDELLFHVDFSFTESPLPFVSLYGLEVDEAAAATLFVNAARAMVEMPRDLRERLQGRTALHASDVRDTYSNSTGPLDIADFEGDREPPGTHHPTVIRHPVTGVEVLFVNQYLSLRIDGLAPEESRKLLEDLFDWLYRPERVYVHRWRPGDLIVFDNVALQHARSPGAARRLRRLVTSDVPLADLIPSP